MIFLPALIIYMDDRGMLAGKCLTLPTADNGWKKCQPQTMRAHHESEAITQMMILNVHSPHTERSCRPQTPATFHHRVRPGIGSNTSFTILHEFLITSLFHAPRQCIREKL